MRLWYKQPAKNWNEALPLGNGKLGCMVFGRVNRERIQLNEDSLWYGGYIDRNNPNSLENLEKIRELIKKGEIEKAEKLAVEALSGVPEGQRHYETLGEMYIELPCQDAPVKDYERELNLEDAIARVSYKRGGTVFKREIFVSADDNVMVLRLTADRPGNINIRIQLSRGVIIDNDDPTKKNHPVAFQGYLDSIKQLGNDCLVASGKSGGENGISFRTAVKAECENGTVRTIGSYLVIEGADTATIYLAAATSFREKDPENTCIKYISDACKKGYELIKSSHIKSYQQLYKRVSLKLYGKSNMDFEQIPTDVRLLLTEKGYQDNELISLYFQYGRYLLISSSRPGSLPANLQGIWNQDMLPIWDSKFTININTQMNYWLAETCNLPECHMPLFDLMRRMQINGRKTAKKMYNCRGWVAHHNTDIWADTAPQDVTITATFWVMGAAWLCLHIWDHYEFSGDLEFLKKYYNMMKEAAEFFLDFLIEDENGYLVTCPSVSPENTYILPNGKTGSLCMGPSMDSQIITELFNRCIRASELLNIDGDFRSMLQKALSKIPQPKIGKYGQIQEWLEDYDELEPGHRHISQLFALHPGTQITKTRTRDLAEAAKKTLERRLAHGGGHTGWSRAWIINMWARLEEAEKAYENILALLQKSTLPNLFSNHPPFQIDGNFGATAGIAEMLLQSHTGEIHLLPALPIAFQSGQVTGLRARGGFEVNITWDNNILKEAVIFSKLGGPCKVRYKHQLDVKCSGKGINTSYIGKNLIEFNTEAGKSYHITIR